MILLDMVTPSQPTRSLDAHVVAELHLPGLGLSQKRWTYHSIFMGEVHRHLAPVCAQATAGYQQRGAGLLFVDAEQWLSLVRRSFEEMPADVAFEYLTVDEAQQRFDFKLLQPSFLALMSTVRAPHQFALVACHHPGDMLSCYIVSADNVEAVGEQVSAPEGWTA